MKQPGINNVPLSVRPAARGLGQVADSAFAQRPWGSLQVDELDRIVGLAGGRDGMGAIVAAFAVDPTVAFG